MAAGRSGDSDGVRAMAGTNPVSAKIKDDRTTGDSLPLCGGGMGWGVVQYGAAVPHRTTPTLIPSPQGGGDEFAARANRFFAFVAIHFTVGGRSAR
jgi:hypothetical protein